jgi:DNA polymerase III epsilon subunit-like protein
MESRKMKRILILDTETTGLDPSSGAVCIEVAVTLFDVKLASPIASYASLIQHDRNEAEAINGIKPELLPQAYEADVVWRAVKWLASSSDAIVCHRAEFDRQFVPSLGKPFICSKTDLEWGGRRGDSLVQLALSLGLGVASAHRAMSDVDILSRIFSRYAEMGNDLEAMLLRVSSDKSVTCPRCDLERANATPAEAYAHGVAQGIIARDRYASLSAMHLITSQMCGSHRNAHVLAMVRASEQLAQLSREDEGVSKKKTASSFMPDLEEPLSRKKYDKLTPRSQGFVSYMRAEWKGWSIPKSNPFESGTAKAKEWDEGQTAAMLSVQDLEE